MSFENTAVMSKDEMIQSLFKSMSKDEILHAIEVGKKEIAGVEETKSEGVGETKSEDVGETKSEGVGETKSEEIDENIEDIEYEEVLTERNIIQYEGVDRIVLERKIQNCKNDILNNHDEKISIIYDNQEECSLSIVSKLRNRKIINVMVVAMTQSGKTGTMGALIKNYLEHNIIPINNIYIITGLSSIEWIEQTKERMPDAIKNRIFHRGNLNSDFINDIKNKKNVLIIMDEVQVAARENQSLNNAFKDIDFYNKQTLFKNDIKIVEFTATPDGTIYDLMKWGENSSKIQMQPGNGYTSCFDLCNTGRVKQYEDLCCYDKNSEIRDVKKIKKNINELSQDINNYDSPMYHIIRTPTGNSSNIVINNFKEYYDSELAYHKYDKDSEIEDINNVLKNKPQKHTFVFIKEKLRCAKTLNKKYLGIVYERSGKSVDDAVIIQGLIGRITGYDNNEKSICYTNIPSIEKYKILWESNFEDNSVKWKSKTTKMKEGRLTSKGTYNVLHSDDSSSVSSDYDADNWYHEWNEFSFSDFENEEQHTIEYLLERVNNWIKEKPGHIRTKKNKRGNKYKLKLNNNEKINGKTFYTSSYTKGLEILNYQDIKSVMINIDNDNAKKTTNLPKKSSCRTYVTYKDINDDKSITLITRYLERIDQEI